MRTPRQQQQGYQRQLARNRVPVSARKTCGWSRPKQQDRVDIVRVVRLIRRLVYDKRHPLRAVVDRLGPEFGSEWVEDVVFYRVFKTDH
jgi:hypothetical protein